MRTVLWWLGVLFGTLSLVLLLKHGFEVSFVSSLQVILDFYENATHALFGWAEPWIKVCLREIGGWFGWTLELNPHWRLMLPLLWVYFGAYARVSRYSGDLSMAVFVVIWGGMVSLVTSVVHGLQPIAPSRTVNIVTPLILLAGLMVFWMGATAWCVTFPRAKFNKITYAGGLQRIDWPYRNELMNAGWLRSFLRLSVADFAIGSLCLATVLVVAGILEHLPEADRTNNPSLIMQGALVVALGLIAFLLGLWAAASRPAEYRGVDIPFWVRFRDSGNVFLGLSIFSALAGATIFVGLNAGLKLAGL